MIQEQIPHISPDGGYILLQSEGTSYLVGYYPSLTTGWQVVGVVPFQEPASGIQQTRFIVAAAVIVSFVVILILSTLISLQCRQGTQINLHCSEVRSIHLKPYDSLTPSARN